MDKIVARFGIKSYLADFGLAVAALMWGSTFFIVKGALAYMDPTALTAYRFLLAAFVLGVTLKLKGKAIFANFVPGLLLGAVLWLVYITQGIGLQFTSAINSGFITGLFVAFTPPLAVVLGREVPSLLRWVAVGVSLAGLWLLTGGLRNLNGGDALTLIAAFTCALHILWIDKYVKTGIDPYVFCFQQILVVGIFSVFYGLATGISFGYSSPHVLWAIFYLALFPTVCSFLLQVTAQVFTAPIKVALLLALEPVFGGIFSWTFGGETFVPIRALGGLLIFLAAIISEIRF